MESNGKLVKNVFTTLQGVVSYRPFFGEGGVASRLATAIYVTMAN